MPDSSEKKRPFVAQSAKNTRKNTKFGTKGERGGVNRFNAESDWASEHKMALFSLGLSPRFALIYGAMNRNTRILIWLAVACFMACATQKASAPAISPKSLESLPLPHQSQQVAFSAKAPVYQLQILHNSDQESGIRIFEDLPRFMQALETLKAQEPNTLVLSSGDLYIPGPFFNATRGKGDIQLANLVGYQASVLGNHEFDLGEKALSKLIKSKKEYPGVTFPLLSCNLDFSESILAGFWEPNGLEQDRPPHKIFPSIILQAGGESIGVVGVTTEELADISAISGVKILPALEHTQAEIDRLKEKGINKIVVLAHLQQLRLELQLASQLQGADIILAGGSDSLLAKATDRLRSGDTRKGDYPIRVNGKDGAPVLVVNTSREYTYLGRLLVSFDEDGVLTGVSDKTGIVATDANLPAEYSSTPVPENIQAELAKIKSRIIELDGEVVGATNFYLNGERQTIRTEETNLGNIAADVYQAIGHRLQNDKALSDIEGVVSLVNGGGIRASIGDIEPGPLGKRVPPLANPLVKKGPGDISLLDVQNAFRFNNEIKAALVTGAELVAWVEHGVAAYALGVAAGRFPQIAGFQFAFDPQKESGNRVKTLILTGKKESQILVKDFQQTDLSQKTFLLITPSFLAKGGDGYPALSNVIHTFERREQELIAASLKSQKSLSMADSSVRDDERIQNLMFRQEAILK